MQTTGYGQLARSIILSLKRHSNYDLSVTKRLIDWHDVPHRAELQEIRETNDNESYDLALHIKTPGTFKAIPGVVNIVYTQNALGSVRPEWISRLQDASSIIVPGEFDAKVFRGHFERVFTCPQHVDDTVFRPMPKYRSEGDDALTFLYIGSWSFRKGCDLIWPAFHKAFGADPDVLVKLHCFSGLSGLHLGDFLRALSQSTPGPKVECDTSALSPAWISRIINRADVIFTLSRGEGWCMPLYEGLLCQKPIIAPASTAMDEYLPNHGVRRISVVEKSVDKIQGHFGAGMRNDYGQPGNCFWEPELDDIVSSLREMRAEYEVYAHSAMQGRMEILEKYSLQKISARLIGIFDETLQKL
jgi:glycosyltransferase involved in cell wall biosynthesis